MNTAQQQLGATSELFCEPILTYLLQKTCWWSFAKTRIKQKQLRYLSVVLWYSIGFNASLNSNLQDWIREASKNISFNLLSSYMEKLIYNVPEYIFIPSFHSSCTVPHPIKRRCLTAAVLTLDPAMCHREHKVRSHALTHSSLLGAGQALELP